MVSFILLFIIPNIFYLLFPIGKFSIFHHLHHYKYVCPCFSRGWLCVFSTTLLKQKISTTTKSILKLNTDFIWWPNICLKSVLYHSHTHTHTSTLPHSQIVFWLLGVRVCVRMSCVSCRFSPLNFGKLNHTLILNWDECRHHNIPF